MATAAAAPILAEQDYETFQKALELTAKFAEEEDTEKPYESQYEARKLLETLAEKLEKLLSERPESTKLLRPALAGIKYLLSKNYVNTQERASGEKICGEALSVLKFENDSDSWIESFMNPENAAICLSILNFLGFIFESLSDHEQAKRRLHEAEKLFQAYRTQFHFSPKNVNSLLSLLCDKTVDEKSCLHTYTLYYLAQVYKNTGDFQIAASYCEKTLVRQLDSGNYDSVDWSLNCATLSQYYFSTTAAENYAQARHCLASAEAVIKHAETEAAENKDSSDPDKLFELDKICGTKADVYRCWAKYGISLLETSQSRICAESSSSKIDLNREEAEAKEISQSRDMSIAEITIKFSGINLGDLENQVSSKHVQSFPEARHVFLKTQGWLNKAKEFYTKNDHATNYVEIVQDMSRLYKALAFFEIEIDRKCKMHKRRLDMLGELLAELNETYYLNVCRQLMFEIGEIANEMLNLKLDNLEEKAEVDNPQATPTPHQVQKVNHLADQAITHFQRFIDTFRDNQRNLPQKFPSDCTRPILLCRFYMGRLWNKVRCDN